MAIDFQDKMILSTRKYLKRKIMCPEIKYRHHLEQRLHILDLLKRTVEAGESNSVLLIGPRGCGKTTVRSITNIEIILREKLLKCSLQR